MPRKNSLSLPHKGCFIILILALVAFLSSFALPKQYAKWLLPSASAKAKTSEDSPSAVLSAGAISFSAPNYNVKEGDGSANITLKRTGGSDGALSAKVTLSDVTTSTADYVYSPGSIDPTFTASPQIGISYKPSSLALQADGKIIAADSRGVWRLNSDGSVDTAFNAGSATNGPVGAVALQPDGKLIIGGDFTTFNNQRVNGVARLNSDGTLDDSFNVGTGPNNSFRSYAVERKCSRKRA